MAKTRFHSTVSEKHSPSVYLSATVFWNSPEFFDPKNHVPWFSGVNCEETEWNAVPYRSHLGVILIRKVKSKCCP